MYLIYAKEGSFPQMFNLWKLKIVSGYKLSFENIKLNRFENWNVFVFIEYNLRGHALDDNKTR